MAAVLLVQGDSRQIPLADHSVHCCITSPPYWGLRDYQTGTWEGGSAACDHRQPPTGYTRNAGRDRAASGGTFHDSATIKDALGVHYGATCGTCGATRIDHQLGLEALHDCLGWATQHPCGACWICHMRAVFREVWRVLRNDGTLWLNCGDTYCANGRTENAPGYDNKAAKGGANLAIIRTRKGNGSLKPKSLCGMPWRLALALQADGWLLRSEIIWHKPSCMPESVTDRPTRSHEQVFLFAKQGKYYYDGEAIREDSLYPADDRKARQNASDFHARARQQRIATMNPLHPHVYPTRNARTVWTIPSEPLPFAHFAAFATALVERCIKAGTSQQGVCSVCGAPWVRMTEKPHGYPSGSFHAHEMDGVGYGLRQKGKGPATLPAHMCPYTTGWRPSCAHDAPLAPAIVFDPFVGSGTVPLTARALGRHGLGTDLSWAYLYDIARQRLGLADLAAWQGDPDPPRSITYTDLPLFTQH